MTVSSSLHCPVAQPFVLPAVEGQHHRRKWRLHGQDERVFANVSSGRSWLCYDVLPQGLFPQHLMTDMEDLAGYLRNLQLWLVHLNRKRAFLQGYFAEVETRLWPNKTLHVLDGTG